MIPTYVLVNNKSCEKIRLPLIHDMNYGLPIQRHQVGLIAAGLEWSYR
jgi:hypothetical protein